LQTDENFYNLRDGIHTVGQHNSRLFPEKKQYAAHYPCKNSVTLDLQVLKIIRSWIKTASASSGRAPRQKKLLGLQGAPELQMQ